MSKKLFSVIEGGGITSPSGFKASGVHAGFRKNPERKDLALIVCEEGAQTVGMFTQNKFCAAPVYFDKKQLGRTGCDMINAVAINSGNANAATGEQGLEAAHKSAEIVANALGIGERRVLLASTGVIGVPLPLEPFHNGIPMAVHKLSEDGGNDAAKAIMTTDTVEKEIAINIECNVHAWGSFRIGGMVKGSGMIQPNMATMIAVITTDLPLSVAAQSESLKRAVDKSFNCVTVDSDTSTNDTVLFMTSGHKMRWLDIEDDGFENFCQCLDFVCIELAKMIAADGEGATKTVQISVEGAKTDDEARCAAREVANSPLVKTAIAGHDANWGRVAAALGKSSAEFDQRDVDIDFIGMPVLRSGLPTGFDEDEALRRFKQKQIDIDIKIGDGEGKAVVWTCDLTHDYISINADYRS